MSDFDSMSQEVPSTGMEKFLEDNFRKILWLFVMVVVALIAYGFIHHQNTVKANEAAEEFTSAKTVEDCDLVISHHPGTNAAANALLLKADLLWDQNKKSSAVDALKEFTTKHAEHPLFVNALLSLGSKFDAMGERKEAQAVFERITREFPATAAAPLAQVRLGDLLWADGKAAEAKKAYEDVTLKFPEVAEFQTLAQDRLNWIAAALPTKEVDAPPAPKPAAAPGAPPAVPGMPKLNIKPPADGIGATIAPPGSISPAPAMPAAATPPAQAPAPAATATPPSAPKPATGTPSAPASAPATPAAPAPVPAAPATPAAPAPVPAGPAAAPATPASAPTAPASAPAAPAPAAPATPPAAPPSN